MWKELLLHFTCDGEFVFQALALLLFLDQLRDRRRHFVERFAQCSKLIVLMNADAMAKVATTHSQRRVIQIAYRTRNRAREDDAGDKRSHLQREKNDSSKKEKIHEQRPHRSNGRQQTAIESRRTEREGRKHGRRGGVRSGVMMQRRDRRGPIHAYVEPMSRRPQRPPAAQHLLARHVEAVLNLERNPSAGFLGRRLEQHHLDRPKLGTEAIKKLGRHRSPYEHEDIPRASGAALGGGNPNVVLEFNDAGVFTAVSRPNQVLATIEQHADTRPFPLGCGDQDCYFRPGKDRFIVRRDTSICFVFDCARDGFPVSGNHAYAFLQTVVKKVRAKLKIQAVGGETGHAKQKDNGHNGYQYVSDDQAIAEAPQQIIPKPRHKPNDKVNYGDEAQEKKQPCEWEPYPRKSEEAKNHIKTKYAQRDAVERRGASEKNDKAA